MTCLLDFASMLHFHMVSFFSFFRFSFFPEKTLEGAKKDSSPGLVQILKTSQNGTNPRRFSVKNESTGALHLLWLWLLFPAFHPSAHQFTPEPEQPQYQLAFLYRPFRLVEPQKLLYGRFPESQQRPLPSFRPQPFKISLQAFQLI